MSPHRADAFGVAGVAELAAQVGDAHVEGAIDAVVIAAIQSLIQRVAGLNLIGVRGEEDEQVELVARQRDRLFAQCH